MNIPLPSDKAIKTYANYGFAGVGFITLLGLFVWVVFSSMTDQQLDITIVKAEAQGIRQDLLIDRNIQEKFYDEMLKEMQKQTLFQQKNCVRLSETTREAQDCILKEP